MGTKTPFRLETWEDGPIVGNYTYHNNIQYEYFKTLEELRIAAAASLVTGQRYEGQKWNERHQKWKPKKLEMEFDVD
jgi:hypothetical protein